MRTRLVRVRRKPHTLGWAVLFLIAAMILYIRVSLPHMQKDETEETGAASRGERVTQEVTIDALSTHLISFGEYDSAPSAQLEAARYVARGAAGYVLEGNVRQVIGAGYDDYSKAQQVCALLQKSEGISASVVSLSAPEITLRMTAGRAQIEAFVEIGKVVRSSAFALLQLSFSLDRSEATALQAGNVIQKHYDQLNNALKTLRAQSAGQENALFESLAVLAENMLEQMEKMQKESGLMALSSRLKYCYIDMRVRQIKWMNDISGT